MEQIHDKSDLCVAPPMYLHHCVIADMQLAEGEKRQFEIKVYIHMLR
jgi:hypothetical protein